MVEEVFDQSANGAILGYHDPRFPITVHRLQLSKSFRLVDWHARSHVFLPVQGIL